MNEKQKLWSINSLCGELQRNFRTVSKALINVSADGVLHGRPAWHLSTAISAMKRYEGRSNRFDGRQSTGGGNEDWRTGEWPLPPYLDAAATKALAMLDRVFLATTVEERKAAYDPALLDAWQAAFRREHREMGSEFEAAYRPTQENGDAYYRALVAKLLAGGDLVPAT